MANAEWFSIYETIDWQPIGVANLRDIDRRHRTAEFGISIGDPGQRGRGYGTEATLMILDYAFTKLELHNVLLTVYAFNVSALRVYQKCGFREIGRRRACYLMGGTLWDEIFMDCLAAD